MHEGQLKFLFILIACNGKLHFFIGLNCNGVQYMKMCRMLLRFISDGNHEKPHIGIKANLITADH